MVNKVSVVFVLLAFTAYKPVLAQEGLVHFGGPEVYEQEFNKDLSYPLASRVDNMCWGEHQSRCIGDKPSDFPTINRHIPCGSGGHSGAHPGYICETTCKSDVGPKCRIDTKPNWGKGGNRCGYRWAVVSCFNN